MQLPIKKKNNSLNQLFEESFRENWFLPALSNFRGETLTYHDLAIKIARLHIFFESCNIYKGDKIALCSKNQVNWAVAYLAIMTYGAVVVPVLHEFQPANIRHLVTHSDAKMFFVGDAIWDSMSDMEFPDIEAVITLSRFEVVYSRTKLASGVMGRIDDLFIKKYTRGFNREDIVYHRDKPDELALISYTSGTSGFSKGVMIPYRALYSNVMFAAEVEPHMNNASKMLSMLPTAHMYGMVFDFLFEMTIGAQVYFLTRLPSPKVILDALAEVKPDTIIAVPMIIEKIYKKELLPFISRNRMKMLLNLPVIDQIVMSRIQQSLIQAFGGRFKEVIIGGAAFNREAEAFFHRISFPFTIGYGMTECAPIITYSPWNKTRLYSCGKAAPRMEIKINSEDPRNIPGEILVKGDNVFLGYYKNEKATKAAFAKGGWLRTGDMGVIDSKGYLYLRGRCKSMILGPSGQNIYPEEIESILNNMPYVTESLVIEDGGKLVALIYPDIDQVEADHLSQEELLVKLQESMQQANLELDSFCKLSAVEIFPEEFEKTPKRSIKRYLYQRGQK